MISILTAILITLAILTKSATLGYGLLIFATVIGISYIVDIIRWNRTKKGNHTK